MDYKNLNVLIADTDFNFLTIAKNKLNARGFFVHTSVNTKETIKILSDIDFDMLLINIDAGNEQSILLDYIEKMKVKPIIIYSNSFSEYPPSWQSLT